MSTRRALLLGLVASSGCATPAPPEAFPPRSAEAPPAPTPPAPSASAAATSAPAERRIVAQRRVPEGDILALAMGSPNCALIRDKGLYCWGFVPLGVPIKAFQAAPARIPGIDHAVATQLPAGSISQAHPNVPEAWWLHEDGRLRFIGVETPKLLGGLGEMVQLGERYALDPTGALHALNDRWEVPPLSGAARRFSTAEANGCAALESGAVECWGFNGRGAVDPAGEASSPDGGAKFIKLARVQGVEGAIDVAVGQEQACALRKDGAVLCWGSGYQGNLGDGGGYRSGAPRGPVRVPGIDDAEQLATDPASWSTCAIRKGGRLSCWGYSGDWAEKDKIEAGPVDIAAQDVTVATPTNGWLCYATKAGEVRCAGLSHVVSGKGVPIPGGGSDRKDVWYGKKPTDFRAVLRAAELKAR